MMGGGGGMQERWGPPGGMFGEGGGGGGYGGGGGPSNDFIPPREWRRYVASYFCMRNLFALCGGICFNSNLTS